MTTVQASCHCGVIRFEAPEPKEITACTCSYCERVGALWAYCRPEELKILDNGAGDTEYRFNTRMIEHHHCAICGCATHGFSPDFRSGEPDTEHPRVGWNVRMAHDFDHSRLHVRHVDGKNEW